MVTAVPDEATGERLVVVHTTLEQSPDELVKGLAEAGLPRLFIPAPVDFHQIDTMPLIGIGKVDLEAINSFARQAARTSIKTNGHPVGRRKASYTRRSRGYMPETGVPCRMQGRWQSVSSPIETDRCAIAPAAAVMGSEGEESMLFYCRFTWYPGVNRAMVARRLIQQHELGTNHPERIRGGTPWQAAARDS